MAGDLDDSRCMMLLVVLVAGRVLVSVLRVRVSVPSC